MKREQKAVPGYEDNYYLDPERMCVVNKKTDRPLKTQYNRDGYAEVQLYKNNKGEHKSLHRLFAEAYEPNPDNLPCVNHKDENPNNYTFGNLEWCTYSYNQNYGTVNKRRGANISKALKGRPRPKGSGRPERPVIARDQYGNEFWFKSGREAARQLGVRQSGITYVLAGEQKTTGGYTIRYVEE